MDELRGGGPPVEPIEYRIYTKEQVEARINKLIADGKSDFQSIYDEHAKIEAEEDAILAARAKKQSATKAADEDDAIEANTGGFTADDIKEALESRTPGMQALLRARPDES